MRRAPTRVYHGVGGSGTNTESASLPPSLALALPALLQMSTPTESWPRVWRCRRVTCDRSCRLAETSSSLPRCPTAPPPLSTGSFASAFHFHKSFLEQTTYSDPTPLKPTVIFPQQPLLSASFMSILAHLHHGRKGCLHKVSKSCGLEEADVSTKAHRKFSLCVKI